MKDETKQIIKSIVANELSIDNVPINDYFQDLGADSLDFLAIVQKAEKRFGISIKEEELIEIETPEDLAICVEKKLC